MILSVKMYRIGKISKQLITLFLNENYETLNIYGTIVLRNLCVNINRNILRNLIIRQPFSMTYKNLETVSPGKNDFALLITSSPKGNDRSPENKQVFLNSMNE